MHFYGERSRRELATIDNDLRELFQRVLPRFDHSVIQGHRTAEQHRIALLEGKTQVPYEKTLHRFQPSQAVDVAPYPIRWDRLRRFYVLAGAVYQEAWRMGIEVRWGGNWDNDDDYDDQSFYDLVHWELIK